MIHIIDCKELEGISLVFGHDIHVELYALSLSSLAH